MRQWVTPRSLVLHVAFLVIASGCLIAAWWQIHRAMAGNTLSFLYSVEWPAFAVVAGIGWWQMFHDTPEDIAERKAHHARMKAASAAVVARTLPRSALAITVDSEDTGRRAIEDGSVRLRALPADTGSADQSLVPMLTDEMPVDSPDAGAEDEMTQYNQYLAYLAVKGQPKTWRNPRGLS
jgi:hypothetical protein